MDKIIQDMIQHGMDRIKELSKKLEEAQKKDKDIIDKLNLLLHTEYSDVLAAQHFLIQNAERIEKEELWRGITPYKIANNFKSIVLLIMYDAYKLANS